MASLFDRYQKEKRLKKQVGKKPVHTPSATAKSTGNTLTIERLSHEGRGVARDAQGKTVFVAGALPGELVTAQINHSRNRYNEAEVSTIQRPSAHRVAPPCPHYQECGGCNLQHLQYSEQVNFKHTMITEHFKREHVVLPASAEPAILSQEYGYRRKARLGVTSTKSQGLVIGFRKRNSNKLTPIQHCLVLEPGLQPLLPALHALVPTLRGKGNIGHIELLADAAGSHAVIRFTNAVTSEDKEKWQRWGEQNNVTLWAENNHSDVAPMFMDSINLSYQIGAINFSFLPTDFLQINAQVNQAMVMQASEWLDLQGSERVLDLFSGFGNFTLPLAQQCSEIIGVEGLASQVAQAKLNATDNGIHNASFYQADLTKPLTTFAWANEPFDVVVLDPPRAGAELVCTAIGELSPKYILYISCNPATLARDAALLTRFGYLIERYAVLDMFPQTAHAETMMLFKYALPTS
ncbi:23S rRNA (uracil(1939)-C(5))-methyltransferase RlmD [Aliidiomarina sp.]|uniref:23S rRNA (uracil(1939)-C(5))-methyltransferase RlmD n=1 Tax=Aliidiomarina sp. TaxID=1872439 RepID=UPI003A4E00B1